MLELATILSEVSLKGQANKGKYTIAQICGAEGEPLYVPRKTDKRPHTWDKKSGAWCLVDSGAQLSIWPKELCPDAPKDKHPRLKAVNGTPITTYGISVRTLNLGRMTIKHPVIVADVQKPILGFDFLENNEVSLIVRRKVTYLQDKNKIRTWCFRKRTEPEMQNIIAATGPFQKYSQLQTVKDGKAEAKQEIPLKYKKLLAEFPGIDTPDFKQRPQVIHNIATQGRPVKAAVRPIGAPGTPKYEEAKRAWMELEKLGVIKRLKPDENSYWTSALHLQLKADGSLRPCGDYRPLNEATELDAYPLPNIRDFAPKLKGANFFAKIDLTKAYYNVGLDRPSRLKTTVITPWGAYKFLRLSMGLRNSAQTFQRLMDKICEGLDVFAYIDDILVYATTEEGLQNKLRRLFERLQEAGLAINRGKCIFEAKKLEFLGYWVTTTGIAPLPRKVKAIKEFPTPTSAKALLGFLGAINYYRRCLRKLKNKSAAEILQPLYTAATRKEPGVAFTTIWARDNLDQHYADAKELLVRATELSYPDPTAPLALFTDASQYGVGGVLQQWVKGRWEPIGWFSKHLSDAQQKWSTFKRELWGILQGTRQFKTEIMGRQDFVIYTDHQPIAQAMKGKLPEHDPAAGRQLTEIAHWTQDIRHVPGIDNGASDWMSRRPDYKPRSKDTPLGTEHQLPTDVLEALQSAGLSTEEQKECLAAIGTNQVYAVARQAPEEWQAPEAHSKVGDDWEIGELEKIAIRDLLKPEYLASEQLKCPETQRFSGTKTAKPIEIEGHVIWCEGNNPYVPANLRRMLFDTFHKLNHPGPESTAKSMAQHYHWKGMRQQVIDWAKECDVCQQSKTKKTILPKMDNRPVTYDKFQDIQVDVVGPLPTSRGHSYILTIICRTTNWFVAAPMVKADAESCAQAYDIHWHANYGCPVKATCDNGTTFTAGLWTTMLKRRGINVEFTPAYHAQSLGSVERQHRDLKIGLRARLIDEGGGSDWMKHLPDVRLGRATAFQRRFQSSSAMAVYGVPLLVPGALRRSTENGPEIDVKGMVEHMQTKAAETPPPTTPFQYDVRYPEAAERATHVYVKVPKKGLGPLMKGPYPIVERRSKSILVLDLGKDASGNDRHKIYHWANCQPANLASDAKSAVAPQRGRPRKTRVITATSRKPPKKVGRPADNGEPETQPTPVTTRYGRASRPPKRH